VFEQLADLETELEKLESQLPEIYASGDQGAARDAGRRHQELRPIVDLYREYRRADAELTDARELLAAEGDNEMREYLRAEIAEKEREVEQVDGQLRHLLIPRDPNDGRNVIVEIRGAEGGEEANLWAADLARMYEALARRRGWRVETLSTQPSEMGGTREVTLAVKAPEAWSRLKYEAGPHRVQRVPVTESQGRVHTSAATVAVLPEAEEVDIQIDDRDLRIDVYRSSGPGGQSVNTTDSAVRITHLPTGLVVIQQDEKSQHKNKAKALKVLRARLYEAQRQALAATRAADRKSQVGSGDRSERVRTYNFPQGRVTDHRINLTLYKIEKVLSGEALDEIIDALTQADTAERLAAAAE